MRSMPRRVNTMSPETPPEPEDDVRLEHAARDAGMSDRAQEHRVHRADRLERGGVEAPAIAQVLLAGPVEHRPLGAEAEGGLAGIEDEQRRVDDLGSDPVAAEDAQFHDARRCSQGSAPMLPFWAMRSVVLGIVVIELLIGGTNDAGRGTETA